MQDYKSKGISLRDLVLILKQNIKKILLVTLVFIILSVIVAFFILKPVYLSSGTIKATAKTSGLSSLLGSVAGGIGDFEDIATGTSGASREIALFQDILLSRKMAEETIIKFELNKEWNYGYFDDAVRNFQLNVLFISANKQSGTLTIGVYDENPQKAKEIVEYIIGELNTTNVRLNVQNAKDNRIFIEERYFLSKKELEHAEDSLKAFQNIYGVAPDLTIKAAVQGQIQLETEIKSEEVKLDILRKVLTPDQPEIKTQEEKIKALYKQMEIIRNSETGTTNLSLKGSPNIAMDFLRLQRNLEIQTKILTFLLPLYEQSKIEENRETPTVQVLDQPFIPDKKAKPKRLIVVLIAAAIGFLGCYFYFLVKYKIRHES